MVLGGTSTSNKSTVLACVYFIMIIMSQAKHSDKDLPRNRKYIYTVQRVEAVYNNYYGDGYPWVE